jgi:hypothetical protein
MKPATLVSLLLLAGPVTEGENVADRSARRTPLIYCTDLFHPHEDPDNRASVISSWSGE